MNSPLDSPRRPQLQPTDIHLLPDHSRVIIRPFIPADPDSVRRIIERAMAIDETGIEQRLAVLHQQFGSRHPKLERAWENHFEHIRQHLPHHTGVSRARRLYLGSLFSGEYAVETAALFNPSIVPHPDQSGVAEGDLRFILSLRATGEGHISSIAFRTGLISSDHRIVLDPVGVRTSSPDLNPDPTFHRGAFFRKLRELEFDSPWSEQLRQSLGDRFTLSELDAALRTASGSTRSSQRESARTRECIRWLASTNYEVTFDPEIPLSQRVIFPNSPIESNGIEDARFVCFTEHDGAVTYYATYTAYNGHAILPQLLETHDFDTFRSISLKGAAVRNKGMSLFPRRIGGKFAMISRQDDENLYLMYSDDPHTWEDAKLLQRPVHPWEAVKIGNCGSPIETPEGWLLLTHGVGAMRRYCIGAMLLDLDDPSIVLGHVHQPLIEPDEPLRNGYVPNVVYTCGALIHGTKLIIPYGLSDTSTTISLVDLSSLLLLLREPHR
ncbi:glycoside hydrolase family 130 protein [Haloferula sargassicola]|uniref:4-O-beta-D-mannosyl-D-glucose phosphorylase n=1 Tax=Haloferula sargassicola TaxID=490096 RepID=A0ABP9UNF0_9BACT